MILSSLAFAVPEVAALVTVLVGILVVEDIRWVVAVDKVRLDSCS